MESHARTERGQTTDKQQRITNNSTLRSRQVSSLISNYVFNIDAPANGAIRLNKVKKTCLPNMVEAWTFSSIQYVQGVVSNVENFLQDLDGSMFSMKINAPLSNGYIPNLDSSPELDGADGA